MELAWSRGSLPVDWLMDHATDTDIATLLEIAAAEAAETERRTRHV